MTTYMRYWTRFRSWVYCWKPFAFRYLSNGNPNEGYVYGIGWRRWVLNYYCKGAYGGHVKPGFSWCNYFGEGDGG